MLLSSAMFPSRRLIGAAALLLAAATICGYADVIHLRSGQDVEGRVVAYANLVFDVATDEAKNTKYQAAQIARIDFDTDPPVNVSAEIRNRGTLNGTLTSYENSIFTLQFGKTPPEKIAMLLISHMTITAPAGKAIEPITHGDEVDIATHIVRGKVTLVEFYGDFHVACKLVSQWIQVMARNDADLVLVRVDIGQFDSAVAKQYAIAAVPRVDVYDRAGKLVGTMEGNRQPQMLDLIKKAKR